MPASRRPVNLGWIVSTVGQAGATQTRWRPLYDTWYGGAHINEWAYADIREELNACWAGFRPAEMVPARRASMDLFQRLADRTARALDLPTFHHGRVRSEVDRILRTAQASE